MLIMDIVLRTPSNQVTVKKGFWDVCYTWMVLEHLICELDGISGFRRSFHLNMNSFPTGLVVVLQVITFL